MSTSYLAGLIAGDGHVEKNSRITISNKNREFLKKVQKIVPVNTSLYYDKHATVWKLSWYSKKLKSVLEKKYGVPPGEKSIKIKPPLIKEAQEIKEYIAGFIRR